MTKSDRVTKPLIKLHPAGYWVCYVPPYFGAIVGTGDTPAQAYMSWDRVA